jgi:hypothetical protein
MSIAEIESAIAQLLAKDFAELMAWIQQYHDRVWDKQIEDDLAAGRLDAIMAEANEASSPGRCPGLGEPKGLRPKNAANKMMAKPVAHLNRGTRHASLNTIAGIPFYDLYDEYCHDKRLV